jgi:uncharacterized protein involved in copper resistance
MKRSFFAVLAGTALALGGCAPGEREADAPVVEEVEPAPPTTPMMGPMDTLPLDTMPMDTMHMEMEHMDHDTLPR